jgi:glycosyltransferase involved in cell wall biosynthesis
MTARVLVLGDHFLPGYKSGGPIRSIANLAACLGNEMEISIVTRDRDLGDTEPFAGVPIGMWHQHERSRVFYLSGGWTRKARLKQLLMDTDYDVLYLNSLFSSMFSILPLWWMTTRQVPRRTTVLAPRGELAPGAMRLKRWKKRAFLRAARTVGLHHKVKWHATSAIEADHLRTWFGNNADVQVAANFSAPIESLQGPVVSKHSGALRVLFLSRICPKKNLLAALQMLRHPWRGQIEFQIAGPIEDAAYWRRCEAVTRSLPPEVTVRYLGPVTPDRVGWTIQQHHLFWLPTLGENFGHAVVEALAVGCPVLLSDQTPWRGLTADGAGWDLSLNRPSDFQQALQHCLDLDNADWLAMRKRVHDYARRHCVQAETKLHYRQLFQLDANARSSAFNRRQAA